MARRGAALSLCILGLQVAQPAPPAVAIGDAEYVTDAVLCHILPHIQQVQLRKKGLGALFTISVWARGGGEGGDVEHIYVIGTGCCGMKPASDHEAWLCGWR